MQLDFSAFDQISCLLVVDLFGNLQRFLQASNNLAAHSTSFIAASVFKALNQLTYASGAARRETSRWAFNRQTLAPLRWGIPLRDAATLMGARDRCDGDWALYVRRVDPA